MSTDKRKVTTDALETLGTIIEDGGRDAIHLAVEPVEAAEDLLAGQHIGLVEGKATTNAINKVGIVDPFISGTIPKGKKFWLVVYPRQITSLRHVWTHPDFEAPKEIITNENPSWTWIKSFADRIRQHPESLMSAADRWVEGEGKGWGDEYTYDNSESYKEHWDEFKEFWIHYEIVRGTAPKSKDCFFTCSC
jgi:hypothetical protein